MYKPILGLEVHIELNTQSKMFCSCRNNPKATIPNSEICPTCVGHPGTLPVINKEAVKKVVKTGLALNCRIPETSKFDRKNYFYPDLPKGYQISQYDKPFCKEGFLEIDGKRIRIIRVHLEEDTGRLIHPVRDQRVKRKTERKQISNGVHERGSSLVDFNRAGIPLMEMVTEPDLTSAKEARKFAEELKLILRYLRVSDADMEKGQMRVEVNISLSKNQKLGTKVEIKNLNSFRSVEKSIDYEVERQAKILDSGKKIIQETRGWNDIKGITVSQREKEEAHDYRYFPEPDLPTLHFDKEFINGVKAEIPELPQSRRERFKIEYGLDELSINIFVSNKGLGEYYEKVVSEFKNWIKEIDIKERISEEEEKKLVKLASNYIITDFWSLFGKASITELENKISPENFAELITLIYKGKLSSRIAKEILREMFNTGADPSHIIEEKGLTQLTDSGEIEEIIKGVISKNPKPVQDYKKGKENALQFLVGQVMAKTRGRAKPDIVQQLLKKLL